MLISQGYLGRQGRLLVPLKGLEYDFVKVGHSAEPSSASRLRELVVLSNSPDCPHQSLRNADGHYLIH